MRTRRPNLFSDSKVLSEPQLTADLLGYHLETLTSRKQETEFENFCRKLCEREICPNLMPQTGPTGGGDSKVDSENYPVSDSIAKLWFEGIGQESARERWGFAFSAKKDWKPKIKSDVAKIAGTNRGYKIVYFVTNQFVPDKERASVEAELSQQFGFSVRLLDRSWITDKVINNGRVQLTIDALGLAGLAAKQRDSPGPLDTARSAELQKLEAEIADPDRYRGIQYQLAEDCLIAAQLARGMERPRLEVDGRFARAERVAEKVGNRQQLLRIAYQKAWTALWWYDDFDELSRLYDPVEQYAAGSEQASDLGLLTNIWQVLASSVVRGALDARQAKFAARTDKLKAELARLAKNQTRPNNALEARTDFLLVELSEAVAKGQGEAIDDILLKFKEVLDAAVPLGSYPLEPLIEILRQLGDILTDSSAYDEVFERALTLIEQRQSEGECGRALMRRGYQKLRAGHAYDAIRHFGRAQEKLIKREYREELVSALMGCGFAYEQSGLLWAAWTKFVAAAVTSLAEFFERGLIVRPALRALQKLLWLELKLGRVPYVLAWAEVADAVAPHLKMDGDDQKALAEERELLDRVLAILLLRSTVSELQHMASLPAILERLDFPHASLALLYALGYEKTLRDEGGIPQEETPTSIREFFHAWLNQPAKDEIASETELLTGPKVTFRSIVLGCEIIVSGSSDPVCLHLMESLLGAVEAFMATSVGNDILAYRQELNVTVATASGLQGLPAFTIERPGGNPIVQIRLPPTFSPALPEERLAFRDWLIDVVAHIVSLFTLPRDGTSHIEQLVEEERVLSRTLQFAEVSIGIENILGKRPKLRLPDWSVQGNERPYPVLRDCPWYGSIPKHESKGSSPIMSDAEPPAGTFELEKIGHRERAVVSLIDIPLWDRARWNAAGFIVAPESDMPPLLALIFRDAQSGDQIFQGWRGRLGRADKDNQLRVSILTGIDRENPAAYKVVVGSNIAEKAVSDTSQILTTVSRINRMDPDSSANLDLFMRQYQKVGHYGLLPGSGYELTDGPTFNSGLVLGKKQLYVRPAWQVGPNELDSMAVSLNDDPIIPSDVRDPPILRVMERLRRRGEH
jgi:hypothetical protein